MLAKHNAEKLMNKVHYKTEHLDSPVVVVYFRTRQHRAFSNFANFFAQFYKTKKEVNSEISTLLTNKKKDEWTNLINELIFILFLIFPFPNRLKNRFKCIQNKLLFSKKNQTHFEIHTNTWTQQENSDKQIRR